MIRLTMQNCSKTTKIQWPQILGRITLGLCLPLSLVACSSVVDPVKAKLPLVFKPYRPDMVQGNFISKEQAARIQAGMDRDEVRVLLGTPLLTSAMHSNRWDYVFAFKRGATQAIEQRQVTIYFENDKVTKIQADNLPSEYELIAEIDGIRAQKRQVNVKAVTKELESDHRAPTVQTIPNPTSGVGIPPGDQRN